MKKWLFILLFPMMAGRTQGQSDLNGYLSTHHYAFSPRNGIDKPLADTLRQKFAAFRVILQAQGGSHFLNLYDDLTLMWVQFLNQQLGVTHFFFETGHSADLLFNRYLDTGDTAYLLLPGSVFWKNMRGYDSMLPLKSKLHIMGIDFESRRTYVRGFHLLLPAGPPPEEIAAVIDLVRNAPDSGMSCADTRKLNAEVKRSLLKYKASFVSYFGDRYADVEQLVLNKGECGDALKNRNGHMAASFLAFDARLHDPIYYGELGMAHTVLINHNVGSILNQSPGFEGKVGVINLYCYQCTTPEETVSNWVVKKIEPEILQFFLPWCTSDFTIFDLTEPVPAIERFSKYGPFLIIARNQH